MNYELIDTLYNELWALRPETLADLQALALYGGRLPMSAAQRPSSTSRRGNVALIPVLGILTKRRSASTRFFGGTSTDDLAVQLRQAALDTSVRTIVLDVDSPGGSVAGTQELAAEILRLRERKPVIAVANSLAASGAYWIASAASEVAVTPSGEVGGIGIVSVHFDISRALEKEGRKVTLISAGKNKTLGNPFEPLTPEAKALLQERVNQVGEAFVSAVAKGRGVSARDVREGFGEGRVVGAKEAVKLGMADRVATLTQTLERWIAGD